jgi:transposase-like protein
MLDYILSFRDLSQEPKDIEISKDRPSLNEALKKYVQEFKEELNFMEEDEDEEDMKIDKE